MESPKKNSLTQIFQSREEAFIHSLENSISLVGGDDYLAQMFENSTSTLYVPKRVCEIITKQITYDRETYINQLEERLTSLEQEMIF